jgi:hypothetical protein
MKRHEHATRGREPGLIVLNLALLAVLAAVTFGGSGRSAEAQMRMARGDYTMISGRAPGSDGGVVYIVDTVNHDMVALTYDHANRQLFGVAYRNLAADAAQAHRAPQPGR